MLGPEVCDFPSPKVNVDIEYCKTSASVANSINKNCFYHNITVICPDLLAIPETIADIIFIDNDYYKLINLPICELIEYQFIKNFVHEGSVVCISLNRKSDVEDCVSLTSTGLLELYLNEQSFQELGIDGGKPVSKSYRVTINLKDRGMHSGTKYYKRLKHCLQKLETCDIIIRWTPPSENVCPSSIAKYFHDKNIAVQVCSPAIKTMSRTMPSMPILNNDNIEEVTEWCGMLVLGGDVKPEVGYVSRYVVPDESTECGPVSVTNVSGFFTYQIVNELYEALKEYIATRELHHWTSLSLQTFRDGFCNGKLNSNMSYLPMDCIKTIFVQQESNFIHTTTCQI